MTTPRLEIGVAEVPRSGETKSGDLHVVQVVPDGLVIAVVDGLGHGEEAARAARTAEEALRTARQPTVISLFRRCHESLRGTRGVVMSLAWFSAIDETLTWLGVGNVEGRLLRAASQEGTSYEALLLRPGLLGHNLPPLRADILTLLPSDTLVLATDGVAPDYMHSARLAQSPQDSAERILDQYGKGTDDALVIVARYDGPE